SPFVPSPTGLAVGQFNGSVDTFPDVVVFGGNRLVVGLGLGNGNFGPFDEMTVATVGAALARGVAGDVNGDGLDDLVVADAGMGGVHVLQSAGDGMTFTPLFSQTGAGASDVALGDFDGNGTGGDIAVANAVDGTVSILIRIGPAYTNAGTLIAGGGPSGIEAADINGDGIDDIVVSNESDDTVTLFVSRQP
ncbi:MAG: VCBS repeat-containing protein, partial [Nannocystaceae bacterium]|nr:VCBS repeat-containing protein [Nannocystaceae bacterium]